MSFGLHKHAHKPLHRKVNMQQKSPFANATVEVDKQLANIYLHSYIDTNTQTSVGRQHLIPLWTYRHGKWLMSTNLASLVATEAYGMVAV